MDQLETIISLENNTFSRNIATDRGSAIFMSNAKSDAVS